MLTEQNERRQRMKICKNEAEVKSLITGGEKKLGLAKDSPEFSQMQAALKGAGFNYKKDFDAKGKKVEEWEK